MNNRRKFLKRGVTLAASLSMGGLGVKAANLDKIEPLTKNTQLTEIANFITFMKNHVPTMAGDSNEHPLQHHRHPLRAGRYARTHGSRQQGLQIDK